MQAFKHVRSLQGATGCPVLFSFFVLLFPLASFNRVSLQYATITEYLCMC